MRRQLAKSTEARLPVMLEVSVIESVPDDLLELATEIRAAMAGQSERVIRRTIRDRLDREKASRGVMARSGVVGVQKSVEEALGSAASSG